MLFAFASRIYIGIRLDIMNGNGFGYFTRKGNPILFWLYAAMYLIAVPVLLTWVYYDYLAVFGRIPGFYPEPVIDAVTNAVQHLFIAPGSAKTTL
jgi:hypothetical protein